MRIALIFGSLHHLKEYRCKFLIENKRLIKGYNDNLIKDTSGNTYRFFVFDEVNLIQKMRGYKFDRIIDHSGKYNPEINGFLKTRFSDTENSIEYQI